MFDIGFSELMLIAVVALVVLGPEKLPKVARTLGHLLGRAQRYVADVKAEIKREAAMDDLRQVQASVREAAQAVQYEMTDEARKVESTLQQGVQAVTGSIPAEPVATPPPAAPSTQLELGLEAQDSQAAKSSEKS